jgi:hypothetical protein
LKKITKHYSIRKLVYNIANTEKTVTDRHDITEILLKVALNTMNQT